MNYTGASGQHLMVGGGVSFSTLPSHSSSCSEVPAWNFLDKQEQLGSYEESY